VTCWSSNRERHVGHGARTGVGDRHADRTARRRGRRRVEAMTLPAGESSLLVVVADAAVAGVVPEFCPVSSPCR